MVRQGRAPGRLGGTSDARFAGFLPKLIGLDECVADREQLSHGCGRPRGSATICCGELSIDKVFLSSANAKSSLSLETSTPTITEKEDWSFGSHPSNYELARRRLQRRFGLKNERPAITLTHGLKAPRNDRSASRYLLPVAAGSG